MQFSSQEPLNKALQEKVDDLLRGHKPHYWHYESRLKSLESFALKVESGRVDDPESLEDFFGCTIVVRNATEIPAAVDLVASHFDIIRRRPPVANRTHKAPDSFPFDDLRLYVKLRAPDTLPRTDIDEIPFEVQIKTFLQHAWGIATHDLVYKNAEVRWSRARIAYQIKAMLEHAELAIEEADRLSDAPLVSKTTKDIDDVSEIIVLLRDRWSSERLPRDLKRLAENIQRVMRCLRLRPARLREIIDAETAKGRGAELLNVSPYTVVIQAVANAERGAFERFLERPGRDRLAVIRELEITSGMRWPPKSPAVIILG